MMQSKALIRSGQIIISPCGVIGGSKEYEFSVNSIMLSGKNFSNIEGVLSYL